MADNYLITGYHGEPHVTAENDRGINAGTFGAGRFVLPVGEQFRAEYIGNNTIRLFDGKLMDNGAAAGIPAGEFIDLLISNAGQGMKRNDLIVFQYEKDDSTGVESGSFVVIQGTETSGTAADPELMQEDLLTNAATFDQMPLWRVAVSGATIANPVKTFGVVSGFGNVESAEYPGCYYRIVDGKQEWITPPMVVGVEYRTTERHKGKVVYTKLIDCGNLPASTTKLVSTIGASAIGIQHDKAFHMDFALHLNTGGICLMNDDNASASNRPLRAYLNSGRNLSITTYFDMSAYTATATFKYTK